MNGPGEETTRARESPATVQTRSGPQPRPRSETIVEPDCVVVAFHLPEVGTHELAHQVRPGLLLVWSRATDLPYHAMVPLPHEVGANPHFVRTHNGVVEFVFARAAA